MPMDTIDADWTAHHDRRIAKEAPMLINGVISGAALTDLGTKYPIQAPVKSDTADAGPIATGHCYCGKIQLGLPLDIKPAISVICHCHDCREWHSVGSLPYMMFPLDVDDKLVRIPIKVRSSLIISLYLVRLLRSPRSAFLQTDQPHTFIH